MLEITVVTGQSLKLVPLLLVATLVATLGACRDGPTAVRSARVRAVKEANGIHLENLTNRASGYFLVDANTLALIDWVPCVSLAPECLRLPANGRVLVPFSEIVAGGAESREVVIYTWWVVPDNTGALAADIDTPITLTL